MNRIKNTNGFTLVEMLVVVAIIAILVGIAISAVGIQLEKAREATDAANIRMQYSQVMAKVIATGESVNVEGSDEGIGKIQLKQTVDKWQTESLKLSLAGILETVEDEEEPDGLCMAWVEYSSSDGKAFLRFSSASAGSQVTQNPYSSFVAAFNGKVAVTQSNYVGSHVTLGDSKAAEYLEFVNSIAEQIGISSEEMYFDYNPYARDAEDNSAGIRRLRYTTPPITLNESGDWTTVPKGTVFTIVDMDKDGNILKMYTSTASSDNVIQVGPYKKDSSGLALWDHPEKYEKVYDASDVQQ